MAIKKTELYTSLWASCDELRGSMDASQYKDYVLTLLFVKYVSDTYGRDDNSIIEVPQGGSFDDLVSLKNDPNIGEQINIAIKALGEANDLKGVIDIADFNDEDKLGKGKAMVDRLTKLVAIFEGLDLRLNRADGDDLLGDAYEYLMRHFATESGKSKGQFYTPAEVSRILAKVVGVTKDTDQSETVYDPTCGSGSLMLKVGDEAPRGMSLYGQEKDNSTAALAKMNMILHGKQSATAEIWQDDTLSDPHWRNKDGSLKTFDFAVANPPFSVKSWSSGITPEEDEFKRFEYGIPPEKNGDYAFLLHILKSLKSTGKGAVILPHGVLFRGNAEANIRRNLVRQGFIKGIIGLPANLFYGTGIPACILVIDKEAAGEKNPIFMIDASKGFIKDGNKNRLREQDLHKIVDVFTKQIPLEGFSRLVPFEEIKKNEFNLNLPRYIDSSDPEDIHDLTAHMNGGIPIADIDALQDYWDVFPSLRKALFEASAREGYRKARVAPEDIRQTILEHEEFSAFRTKAMQPFEAWIEAHKDGLDELQKGIRPKQVIADLSEDLLNRYASVPLMNRYDVYQILMDFWADTMQDDVFMIAQDGWAAGNAVRQLIPKKDKNGKNTYSEAHDFEFNKVRYVSDLIPPPLVVAKFLASEQAHIDTLQADFDRITQEIESYVEEHSGEEGLIDDAVNDNCAVSQKSLKDTKSASQDADEIAAFDHAIGLLKKQSAAKKAVKTAQEKLDQKVFVRVPKLSEAEIKALVIEDKWSATLHRAVENKIERGAQFLADRVRELEERYAEPLPALSDRVEGLSGKVEVHLRAMGVSW
jgi:type I restriction enzyme M protein